MLIGNQSIVRAPDYSLVMSQCVGKGRKASGILFEESLFYLIFIYLHFLH